MGKTTVSIFGDQFRINGIPTYEGRRWQGHRIEGLLMNARLVQGVFDDRNRDTVGRWAYPDTGKWDPERNTREFIKAMPQWRRHGLLAFTLNLQGGTPQPYARNEPWHNSAMKEDGSLRTDYLGRLERIVERADELGMVIILGIFHSGQDEHVWGEDAVIRAVDNTVHWLLECGHTNVLLEINNECNGSGYDHPVLKPDRVSELIERAKRRTFAGRRLLVGTSFGGGAVPGENVLYASDFLLLHGSGVSDPKQIREMVRQARHIAGYHQNPMPILFNEDNNGGFDQEENNFVAAVTEYASWGYYDQGENNYRDGYQSPPVNWEINTEQKQAFLQLLATITGAKV